MVEQCHSTLLTRRRLARRLLFLRPTHSPIEPSADSICRLLLEQDGGLDRDPDDEDCARSAVERHTQDGEDCHRGGYLEEPP